MNEKRRPAPGVADASQKPAGPTDKPDNITTDVFPKPEQLWVRHVMEHAIGSAVATCTRCKASTAIALDGAAELPPNAHTLRFDSYWRGDRKQSATPLARFVVDCRPWFSAYVPRRALKP